MVKKCLSGILAACILLFLFTGFDFSNEGGSHARTLIHVSYDTTRELFEAYNPLFQAYWKQTTGQKVEIVQSHGGSGKQALEVTNGLAADVLTLALAYDVDEVEKEGLLRKDWQERLSYDASPFYSVSVFVVRKGNPKQIHDWDDLVREDVNVVTPNPKTSGGARWNFLSAWAYALLKYSGTEAPSGIPDSIRKQADAYAFEFVRKLYANTVVLDSGARGSAASFTENHQGDVLIAAENEARLLEKSGAYEVVIPSVSMQEQIAAASVDGYTKERETTDLSEAYLKYLYSDRAQRLFAQYDFRPSNPEILSEYRSKFPQNLKLIAIDEFGGWDKAGAFFETGGSFDRMIEKNARQNIQGK